MSHTGITALQIAVSAALVILVAYAAGRVHEWYRHSLERDQAFREGYHQASRSLYQLATSDTAHHPHHATTVASGPAEEHR